jgi:hypothetical protein
MADYADSIDITTDLNSQSPDAAPSWSGDVPADTRPDKPASPSPSEGTPQPEPSLRDLLSDAFKDGGKPAPQGQAPVDGTQTPAGAPSDPNAPDLVKVGDRYHHRDGRFAAREDIEAFERGQAPAGQAPQLPQWASSLTPLEQQQFNALPAETRQFVERTMDGVNTRGKQYDDYGIIDQVLNPRKQAWASNGMTPAVALTNLLNLSDFAGRDPASFVMWFAEQQRLDLDALLDARDASRNGQATANPQLTGLQQEIAQLRNVINGFNDQGVQQRQSMAMQAVQAFADEKDASGNPAYPYFGALSDDIANHVALIRQSQPHMPERDILKAAYDFAAYNNPAVRGAMQQSQVKAQQEQQAAEAARARKIGVSINGGPAGDTSQQPNNANRTLREELESAFRDASQ